MSCASTAAACQTITQARQQHWQLLEQLLAAAASEKQLKAIRLADAFSMMLRLAVVAAADDGGYSAWGPASMHKETAALLQLRAAAGATGLLSEKQFANAFVQARGRFYSSKADPASAWLHPSRGQPRPARARQREAGSSGMPIRPCWTASSGTATPPCGASRPQRHFDDQQRCS